MNLTFMHPSGDEWFDAEVDPNITGGDTLKNLQEAGFLAEPKAGDYNLVVLRSGQEIAGDMKTMPFESLGVQPGDKIAVTFRGRGART